METEQFKNIKNLIFGRYKIIRKLDEGSFGIVCLGINIKTNEKVAIKLEPRNNPLNFLETEAYYLFILKGTGIPKIHTYGQKDKYNILVESLLGKSLNKIFFNNNRYLCIKDVSMIAIQVIERLKFIHSKYIIHRDIKPENFLIGYDDPFIIYLIDFGLSKKYRSSRTGRHVQFSVPKRITGTARYSSLNSLRGCQVSRRDDLEAVAYMLIFFMRGDLPWEGVEAKNKTDKYRKIYRLKKLYTPEKLCQNLPKEMSEFLRYCRNLDFEQEPNYEYCSSLFNNILIKNGTYNDLIFSWIDDLPLIEKIKNINEVNNLAYDHDIYNPGIYDISKRKSSPQTRIYRALQTSFEKKRRLNSYSNMNIVSLEENYLSDKKFSVDTYEKKPNELGLIKKFRIDYIKVNSIVTNDSSNINSKNKDNNKDNNIFIKKQEQEKKNSNSNLYENVANKNFEEINITKNIKYNNKKNSYNSQIQSFSEKKKNIPNNNIIIEKIDKKKFGINLLENKNTTFNDIRINNKIDNINILNNELKKNKKNKNNELKIKLINIEKNNLKKNLENNTLYMDNLNIKNNGKRQNNKNEEKNIIRITNICKTKINDKKNYYNKIQSQNNVNFKNPQRLSVNNTKTNNKIYNNIRNNNINNNQYNHINFVQNNTTNNINNNHIKIINKILKLNKINSYNQSINKKIDGFNLKNNKINLNIHDKNKFFLEKKSLSTSNNIRKNYFLNLSKSNYYPIEISYQNNIINYAFNDNNLNDNQILYNNHIYLNKANSNTKLISNSLEEKNLGKINISQEAANDILLYQDKKKYLQNSNIKANNNKESLINNKKRNNANQVKNKKKEMNVKQILLSNNYPNINKNNKIMEILKKKSLLNNNNKNNNININNNKNFSNFLSYNSNIKATKQNQDKVNYIGSLNNAQNINNSALKSNIIQNTIKLNHNHFTTDVNPFSFKIKKDLLLNQAYHLNNSLLKEKNVIPKNNSNFGKKMIKPKGTSNNIKNNVKIKNNIINHQNHSRNENNILQSQIFENYNTINFINQNTSKLKAIFGTKDGK